MKTSTLNKFLIILGGIWLACTVHLRAEESILHFVSRISIQQDASLIVEETIQIRAENQQVRHGIYRDFPTQYRDRMGNKMVVGFQVISVQKNGGPEPYFVSEVSQGQRVYIGDRNMMVSPGIYTYILTYRTTRQIGFFKDHDELYWNVTGSGWGFPIDKAEAEVTLPVPQTRDHLQFDAFTGPKNAQGKAFQFSFSETGVLHCETTARLNPGEGLTIVFGWPKGVIQEPSSGEKARNFFNDNYDAWIATLGLLIVLAYYGFSWLAVGKDPTPGVIIPLYEPPSGLSPASMRYILKMGYDDKSVAAALVHLAVLGHIKLKQDSSSNYSVENASGGPSAAPCAEELILKRKLLQGEPSIQFEETNHSTIQAALSAFKNALHTRYDEIYFHNNRKFFVIGILISLVAPLIIFATSKTVNRGALGFMSIWLTAWTFGLMALMSNVFKAFRKIFQDRAHQLGSIFAFVFISLFSVPFLVGEVIGMRMLGLSNSPAAIFILFLTGLTHLLFYHLLKAPTMQGRQTLDQIEGFKLYLGTAEGDRYQHPPLKELTPEHFEKYLPYAIAFDLEDQWSSKFAALFATAAMASYAPIWYAGPYWSHSNLNGFTSSLGSSFGGAIASSAVAPSSSSGFGGGSSGGGGGGGGGGGW